MTPLVYASMLVTLLPSYAAAQEIQPNSYRPGNGVSTPVVVRQVPPAYPAMSRGVQGLVQLECVVEPDGSVSGIRVVKSLEPSMDAAAIAALKEWRFTPGMKEGTPVRVLIEVALSFTQGLENPRLDSIDVFEPGAGVTVPLVLKEVKPEYPEAKRGSGLQGIVVLECVVRSDGRVGDTRVTRSLDPDLDREAVAALKQWRFKPGERKGQPVAVQVNVEITFALK